MVDDRSHVLCRVAKKIFFLINKKLKENESASNSYSPIVFSRNIFVNSFLWILPKIAHAHACAYTGMYICSPQHVPFLYKREIKRSLFCTLIYAQEILAFSPYLSVYLYIIKCCIEFQCLSKPVFYQLLLIDYQF